MTRFLASLAARSIGREEVLEPRRPFHEPRAEPLVEHQDPQSLPPVGGGTERADLGLAPAPVRRRSVHAGAGAAAPPRQPRRSPSPPVSGPERASVESSQSPVAVPFDGREALVDAREARASPERAAERRAAQRPTASQTSAHASRESARPQRTAPAPAEPSLRAAARFPTTGGESRSQVAPKLGLTAREPHEPNVVRITIGRVEVHAVPGAEDKKPRKRAAPARMTLDEYLRRGRR